MCMDDFSASFHLPSPFCHFYQRRIYETECWQKKEQFFIASESCTLMDFLFVFSCLPLFSVPWITSSLIWVASSLCAVPVSAGSKTKYIAESRASTAGLKIHPGHNSRLACLYSINLEQRLTAFSGPNISLLSFGLWSIPRWYNLSNSVSLFPAGTVFHIHSGQAAAAAGAAGLQQAASPGLSPCWMCQSLSQPFLLQKERKAGNFRRRVDMCSERLDLVFFFLDSPVSLPDFVFYR